MASPAQPLPLFPLHTVLFPGMVLPLRIFEERYKVMIRRCQDGDFRFGVVLIKEGQEVGEPAIPHQVGTVAYITQIIPLEEGRMSLLVVGERRFRIQQIPQWRPFLTGLVDFPEEALGEPPPGLELVDALRRAAQQYLRALGGLRGAWVGEVQSPADPVALSFFVASVLQGTSEARQRILEAPTARERLELLAPLLQQEHRRLQEELTRRLAGRERLN